ncbi:response regulator [Thermoproteota archaeon]
MEMEKIIMNTPPYKILIIDDEEEVLKAIQMTIKRNKLFNSEITTALNTENALSALENHFYDLVLSDYKMPNVNGIEFIKTVMEKSPQTIRILITGYSDANVAQEAINKHYAHNYIDKPWDNDELVSIVHTALLNR